MSPVLVIATDPALTQASSGFSLLTVMTAPVFVWVRLPAVNTLPGFADVLVKLAPEPITTLTARSSTARVSSTCIRRWPKRNFMRFILASICAPLAHLSRFSGFPVSRRPSLECHFCPAPAADLTRGLEPFRTDPAWSFHSYRAPRPLGGPGTNV